MANLIPEDKIPPLARKPLKAQVTDELYTLIHSMAQGFGASPEGAQEGLKKVGLEKSKDYDQQAYQGSVSPFGFKKLLSTSHEQADVFQAAIKQEPKKESLLRSMFDLVTKKKPGYVNGALIVEDTGKHPQGALLDKLNKGGKSKPSSLLLDDNVAGVTHPGGLSWSKGMGSNMSHEHIHKQIASLNRFDPNASQGFYLMVREKMPIELKSHLMDKGIESIELLPAVRDVLTDKETRMKILPRNTQDYTTLKHQAQTYWNEIAEKAKTMTQEQVQELGELARNWKAKP
jgi:hypothetical protein